MEVRKLVQLVAMLACSSVYAEIALDSPDRRIAAFATHFVEPTQWEDQNYWRDHWSVATVVFDLDGDGVCDALVCTPDEQASTYLGWLPIHQGKDGAMLIEYDLENTERINCRQDSFCVASISNDVKVLVGLGAYVEKYEAGKRVWNKTGDVLIKMDSQGKLKTTVLPEGGLLRQLGFSRLERINPKWYVGYRLELKPADKVLLARDSHSFNSEVAHGRELCLRINWFDGTSTLSTIHESKEDAVRIRESLMNGRIKSIERLVRSPHESNSIVAKVECSAKSSPEIEQTSKSQCCLNVEPQMVKQPDKPGKKIVRHKVRDEDDVTGLSIMYGVSSEEIRRRNNLKPGEDPKTGQILELETTDDYVDAAQ